VNKSSSFRLKTQSRNDAQLTIEVSSKLEVSLIGSAPNIWKRYIQGKIAQSVEGRKLAAAFKVSQSPSSVTDNYQCFDTKRLQSVDLDGFVLFAMANAKHSMSLESTSRPVDHQGQARSLSFE